MSQQRSFLIFLGLWTIAFAIFSTINIRKYVGPELVTFLTGETIDMTPVEWRKIEFRPAMKMVIIPVSESKAIAVRTWRKIPETTPLPAEKLRLAKDRSGALMSKERWWIFGLVALFFSKKAFIALIVATALTAAFWAPLFSGKSSLDRHRDRERRRRWHRRASKFPAIWIKVISILFIALAPLIVWWSFADVIPGRNVIAGWVLIALAVLHIPVFIGSLLNKPAARLMVSYLPWSWMIIPPVGTILAVITLAALPHLKPLETEERHGG